MKDLNEGLLSGHACWSKHAEIEVHFRNLEEVLLRELVEADIVLGCVAWITSEPILEELARRTTCLILDHKIPTMPAHRKEAYAALQYQDKTPIYNMLRNGHGWEEYFCYTNEKGVPLPRTMYGDWNFEAGLYRVDGGRYRYLHHKFLIMLKSKGICTCGKDIYEPTVWTGSFNLTKNAKTGLENATIIRDPAVCASFLCEFLEVYQHHALQLNITDLPTLYEKGWKDTNNGQYAPLCHRLDYFPFKWFIPCHKGKFGEVSANDQM